MKNWKKINGFTPVMTLLIVAGIALFSYGAYRIAQRPASLAPQEQLKTETESMSGVNDIETDTEIGEGVLENPSIGPEPLWLEEEKVQTEEEAFGTNYSRTGVLLRQSGSGLEGWYILYDTPGNPATTNPLKFTNESKCDMGQGEAPCDAGTFTQGDNISVDGNVQQNIVTVFVLKKL